MKGQYKTKQREELLSYLQTLSGKQITVNHVCDYFKAQGKKIGTTTVYRQLERMVDEGVVNKYIVDSNSPAWFEYIGEQSHCVQPVCFHCKCEKCGRLIHLHCNELAGIQKHMLEHHSFQINPMRTVFYGICDVCRENWNVKQGK
ncbi:MAG: transcriptional repressor [Clostridia bacterium]|nr:transcriptional repressor [Anaerotignum sp.]NCC17140.1 transcriptional repressor [Clostridia bacterium]